jgi:hypothetical protein
MTLKQKWEQDHPGGIFLDSMMGCPNWYGYGSAESDIEFCKGNGCVECWSRDIPGEEPVEKHDQDNTVDIPFDADGKFKAAAKAIAESAQNAVKSIASTIKDSGDRTQFASGAVRDMREGKGRCDLMPLEVVAEIYHKFMDDDPSISKVFADIANFKRLGSTDYLYMALDDADIFCGWETMLLEVAKHFEEGAKKYGENNWQKGIPVRCYIDSAIRHYLKWLRGDKDEPHDRAFVWNIMCCIWEVDYRDKMNDGKCEEDS